MFGSAISASTDEREMIAVPQIGEEEEGHVNHVPKSYLVGIVAPRLEETFELVRNRLEASGFDKVAGRRVVLTGGACQLHGAREFAALILDKQVRHRPAAAGRRARRGDRGTGLFDRRRAACISPCRSGPRRRRSAPAPVRAASSIVSAGGCARICDGISSVGAVPPIRGAQNRLNRVWGSGGGSP